MFFLLYTYIFFFKCTLTGDATLAGGRALYHGAAGEARQHHGCYHLVHLHSRIGFPAPQGERCEMCGGKSRETAWV